DPRSSSGQEEDSVKALMIGIDRIHFGGGSAIRQNVARQCRPLRLIEGILVEDAVSAASLSVPTNRHGTAAAGNERDDVGRRIAAGNIKNVACTHMSALIVGPQIDIRRSG